MARGREKPYFLTRPRIAIVTTFVLGSEDGFKLDSNLCYNPAQRRCDSARRLGGPLGRMSRFWLVKGGVQALNAVLGLLRRFTTQSVWNGVALGLGAHSPEAAQPTGGEAFFSPRSGSKWDFD